MSVCLNYKDQICAMNAWRNTYHLQLEQCYRSQTYYTGSTLTREGIPFFHNSENLTATRKKRTLLRVWIKRSIDKTIIHKEKLVYDWKDFLSGVGGTLSLLIGISFFSLCNQIIDTMSYGFKMLRKNLKYFGKSKKTSLVSFDVEFGSSAQLTKTPKACKIPRPLANKTLSKVNN